MAEEIVGGVRPEVARLQRWAPLPAEALWEDEELDRFVADVDAVAGPVTAAERALLLTLLDRLEDDTVYGTLFGVRSLIETGPDDGYEFELDTTDRPWYADLRLRRENAQRWNRG